MLGKENMVFIGLKYVTQLMDRKKEPLALLAVANILNVVIGVTNFWLTGEDRAKMEPPGGFEPPTY